MHAYPLSEVSKAICLRKTLTLEEYDHDATMRNETRQGRPDTGGNDDPLERLLGLLDEPTQSRPGEPSRVRAVGGQDEHPTWPTDHDWWIFALPAPAPI